MVLTIFTATREAALSVSAVRMQRVEESQLHLHFIVQMVIRNYPGNFTVTVTYTLSDENGLSLQYDMESDKDTLANLTKSQLL